MRESRRWKRRSGSEAYSDIYIGGIVWIFRSSISERTACARKGHTVIISTRHGPTPLSSRLTTTSAPRHSRIDETLLPRSPSLRKAHISAAFLS